MIDVIDEPQMLQLLRKSVNGTLTKEEADQLTPMLQSELINIKDRFNPDCYIITVKNDGAEVTGIISDILTIACHKIDGVFKNNVTNESYSLDSVLSSRRVYY
jgi:hypothetical protein